jgi:DNA-binding MarR family transcriptional regulator
VNSNPCHGTEIPFGAEVALSCRARIVYLNNRLRRLGLTIGQWPVLMLLAKKQNITQETLVRYYRIDRGTIARAVRKLEDGGYIRRIPDPENRRAVRLFLTRKGEEVIPVLRAMNDDWETLVFRGLPGADQETLRSLMRSVTENSMRLLENNGEDSCAGA